MDASAAAPARAPAPAVGIALKEWAVVVRALEEGRQILLLRKGGIREEGGEFRVDHTRFFLFPTWEHQDARMVKPLFRPDLAAAEAAGANQTAIPITSLAEVTDVLRPRSPEAFEAISDRHVWTPAFVRMRFDYMPDKPLYALLARVRRLAEPHRIPIHPDYAGCRSWVPLKEPIPSEGASPALPDAGYEEHRRALRDALG